MTYSIINKKESLIVQLKFSVDHILDNDWDLHSYLCFIKLEFNQDDDIDSMIYQFKSELYKNLTNSEYKFIEVFSKNSLYSELIKIDSITKVEINVDPSYREEIYHDCRSENFHYDEEDGELFSNICFY